MLASNDSSIMMLGVTFQRRLDGSFHGDARFASLSHSHGFVSRRHLQTLVLFFIRTPEAFGDTRSSAPMRLALSNSGCDF